MWKLSLIFAILWIFLISGKFGQLLQPDGRCFLPNGGSTLTYFIKEDLKVGDAIGSLNIQGRVGRDIDLNLEDINGLYEGQELPVQLEGENLILVKPLDKEGIDGADSILVDVVCQRQRSSDPSFTIPVHVRVTDVNDNSPVFTGAPFNLSLSELTVVGSKILTVTTSDSDQPGPFSTVEYYVVDGPFSDYVAFENPLEGDMVLTKSLDYEALRSISLQIEARDQGAPPMTSRALVTINVIDADDQNPAFLYERYDALLPPPALVHEESHQGYKLFVQPQDLRAFDKDLGISAPIFYSFNSVDATDETKYFELNKNTGHIYVKSRIPDSEFLQPVTLVIKATQFDNVDRYTVTTLTITRDGNVGGSNLQFLQHNYKFQMLENVPLNSVIGTLLTNRPNDRRIKFSVSGLPNEEFSVNSKGDVILRKTVDYELQEFFSFVVFISDGRRNDSAKVNVSLLNINDWDPRFKYPQYEFFVQSEDAYRGHFVGNLEVHDGDKGDKVSLSLRGPHSRIFSVNDQGDLTLDDLDHLNTTETHLVAVAKDSGSPPRETSVPVLIRFGEDLFARYQTSTRDPDHEKFTLTVVLGLLLTVFLIIILGLVVYICKDKKKHNKNITPRTSPESSTVQGDPDPSRIWVTHPNHLHRSEPDLYLHSGSTKSSSVTSLPQLTHHNSSSNNPVALNPLNPQSSQRYASVENNRHITNPSGAIHQNGLPDMSNHQQALRDSIFGGTGTDLSRLQWPRNSIPRRVKKLSWEDESYDLGYDRDISTFTDPDVSVTPLELQLEPSQVGRAIYF